MFFNLYDNQTETMSAVELHGGLTLQFKGQTPSSNAPLKVVWPIIEADVLRCLPTLVGREPLPCSWSFSAPSSPPSTWSESLILLGLPDFRVVDFCEFKHDENEPLGLLLGVGGPALQGLNEARFAPQSSLSTKAQLTLGEAVSDFHGAILRFALLSAKPRELADELDRSKLERCAGRLGYFYGTLRRASHFLEAMPRPLHGQPPKAAFISSLKDEVVAALLDGLNTQKALALMSEAFVTINELLGTKKVSRRPSAAIALEQILAIITALDSVFGLFSERPDIFLRGHRAQTAKRRGLDENDINLLIAERIAARTGRDWARADQIANELGALGIVLMDRDCGTEWRFQTPEFPSK